MTRKKAKIVLGLLSAFFIIGTVVGIILLWDFITTPDIFRSFIAEHRISGGIVLVVICALQVIFALIPGEFTEIASGYAFGPVWGTVLCLFGILLGSVALIFLIRRFGKPFAEILFDIDKLNEISFLHNKKTRNTMTVILYLLPGTPKDMITLLLAFTDMSIPLYLLLTGITRLPSIIVSTVGGGSLGDGRYMSALVALGISAAVSIAGFGIYQLIRIKKNGK